MAGVLVSGLAIRLVVEGVTGSLEVNGVLVNMFFRIDGVVDTAGAAEDGAFVDPKHPADLALVVGVLNLLIRLDLIDLAVRLVVDLTEITILSIKNF